MDVRFFSVIKRALSDYYFMPEFGFFFAILSIPGEFVFSQFRRYSFSFRKLPCDYMYPRNTEQFDVDSLV